MDGGIRILPVAVEKSDELTAAVPGAWIAPLKPGPNLPGVEQEQGGFATPFVILTSTNVDDDIVYNFVKAIHANKDALVSSHGAFNGFNPANMHADIGVPFHDGAEKFYAEMGM